MYEAICYVVVARLFVQVREEPAVKARLLDVKKEKFFIRDGAIMIYDVIGLKS